MVNLAFQMPRKVLIDSIDENHGIFIFEPLEKGYGVTIGNTLRRVLISSLEGYAISSIKIPNILHEFSSVDGVLEDVADIILNLKKIRLHNLGSKLQINSLGNFKCKVEGKDRVTAEDLFKSKDSVFKVLNPDLVICHLSEGASFEMEGVVKLGRGYVLAEENKLFVEEEEINTIAIDSIFTPIRNVKYGVENTRVEQRIDYEKLSIEVETDGSIDSETAMRNATDILMKHFALLSTKGLSFEPLSETVEEDVMSDEMLRVRKLLVTSITNLNLSVRALNCLNSAKIRTFGDLVVLKLSEVAKFRNLGEKSLSELQKLVSDHNLKFGMNLSKYKLGDSSEG